MFYHIFIKLIMAGTCPEHAHKSDEGGNDVIPRFSGEFHGHKSLVGYSPWGFKESDMTEQRLNNKWRGPHHKDKGQPPANCPQELNPAPPHV